LPVYAHVRIDVDDEPGEYTLKITVKDRLGKAEKVLTREFEVVKPTFNFVRLALSTPTGDPQSPVAVPAQKVMVHCALVGFELGKDKQPHVHFELLVKDEAGKQVTGTELFKGDIKTELKTSQKLMTFLPMLLELNRVGKFTIVLKATDKISKKSAEQTLDLKVIEP